jgi:hypothetical protein
LQGKLGAFKIFKENQIFAARYIIDQWLPIPINDFVFVAFLGLESLKFVMMDFDCRHRRE